MLVVKSKTGKKATVGIYDVRFGDKENYAWPTPFDELILDFSVESVFRFQEDKESWSDFFKKIPPAKIVLQVSDISFADVSERLNGLPEIRNRLSAIELRPYYHLKRVGSAEAPSAALYRSFDYVPSPSRHFIFMNRSVNFSRNKFAELLSAESALDNQYYMSWLNRFKGPSVVPDILLLDDKTADHVQHQYPPQYCDAIVDVFCETNSVFSDLSPQILTEKTWRPLLTGHLFLGFGFVGMYQFLQKQGFEIYDEIFDYSFDTVSDFDTRMQKYFDQLKIFSKHHSVEDFKAILARTSQKRKHNQFLAQQMAQDELSSGSRLFVL